MTTYYEILRHTTTYHETTTMHYEELPNITTYQRVLRDTSTYSEIMRGTATSYDVLRAGVGNRFYLIFGHIEAGKGCYTSQQKGRCGPTTKTEKDPKGSS